MEDNIILFPTNAFHDDGFREYNLLTRTILFSSDWEMVLSSRVIQLRGCITWLTHVPHARVCVAS